MSGTYPTTPGATSIKITGISPTLVSVTHSLKRQARRRGGQRWAIEANYPPMTRAIFAPLWAFVNSQQGQYGTFTYQPPIYSDSSGTATGTLLVNNVSGYAAGSTSIASDGLTGTLKAGDFIKFSGHDKVYMLTADGSTTLTIEPPLVSALVNDETVTYQDVPFTMAFTADNQVMSMGTEQFVGFAIKLVEIV
jgi:hypothetical protein